MMVRYFSSLSLRASSACLRSVIFWRRTSFPMTAPVPVRRSSTATSKNCLSSPSPMAISRLSPDAPCARARTEGWPARTRSAGLPMASSCTVPRSRTAAVFISVIRPRASITSIGELISSITFPRATGATSRRPCLSVAPTKTRPVNIRANGVNVSPGYGVRFSWYWRSQRRGRRSAARRRRRWRW
ncbi:MAG: hypothetical protein BWX50_00366 [Euryarchaeota archaeon ADurb.Bin009]|nr:MAG: hypothetical protein BWX50_00366 [Euryarchaeota archaeon ADurb.Bin009]